MSKFQPQNSTESGSRLPVPLWKIIAIAVAAGVLCIVWLKKEIYHDQLARRVLTLEQKEDSLRNELRILTVEYQQLSEPARIEKAAREKLGMIFPNTACDTVWIPESSHSLDEDVKHFVEQSHCV